MKHFLFLFSVLVIISCSSNASEDTEESLTRTEKYFPGFPDEQFKNITLGDSISRVNYLLQSDGYEIKENEPNHLINKNWETEIILAGDKTLNGFKVFIFNQEDIIESVEFKDFFKSQAISNHESRQFSVYEFETDRQAFSLTLFELPDLLRINIELKSSH